jgi:hypothetical protein
MLLDSGSDAINGCHWELKGTIYRSTSDKQGILPKILATTFSRFLLEISKIVLFKEHYLSLGYYYFVLLGN